VDSDVVEGVAVAVRLFAPLAPALFDTVKLAADVIVVNPFAVVPELSVTTTTPDVEDAAVYPVADESVVTAASALVAEALSTADVAVAGELLGP
jgi:hypothetical protein